MLRALLFTLLLALPASAELIWESEAKERPAIERLYRREFPRRGKELPARLKIVSRAEFLAMGAPKWAIGWYEHETPRLWVADEGRVQNVRTATHEYGHWFYYRVMSETERQDWERWWKANRHLLPTDYARTNASEGFAVAFEWQFSHGREALAKPVRRQLKRYFRLPKQ